MCLPGTCFAVGPATSYEVKDVKRGSSGIRGKVSGTRLTRRSAGDTRAERRCKALQPNRLNRPPRRQSRG
jgi:hypothetical protein